MTSTAHDGLKVVGSLAQLFGSGFATAANAAECGTYELPPDVGQALRQATDAVADLGSAAMRAEINRFP